MKHRLPPEFTERAIHVAIAGAGGNGSQMLSGLARMHVALVALGHPGFDVCVFDPDVVTPANIGRQLFSPADIGANKAAVLVNRVNMFYNLDWNAEAAFYKAGARWSDQSADILVGCVDSAAARRELAKARFKYWLDLGNTDRTGQVILGTRTRPKGWNRYEKAVTPKLEKMGQQERVIAKKMIERQKKLGSRSSYWHQPPRPRLVTEIFPELRNKRRKEDTAPSCSLAEALDRQDLFINQAVATFALQLLWQFIRKGGLDVHGYFINLETGNVRPLALVEETSVRTAKKANKKRRKR